MSDGRPRGAGKSSFDLIDQTRFFEILDPTPGSVFLDLGSGEGNYALPIAKTIGAQGKVYAFDAWAEGIEELNRLAAEQGLGNLEARSLDLREGIPLTDKSADTCFMATVLHDLVQDNLGDKALSECTRLLKPGGKLVVVEFKKIDGPPGPPINIRLNPEELERLIMPFGFTKTRVDDLGPYLYCLVTILLGK